MFVSPPSSSNETTMTTTTTTTTTTTRRRRREDDGAATGGGNDDNDNETSTTTTNNNNNLNEPLIRRTPSLTPPTRRRNNGDDDDDEDEDEYEYHNDGHDHQYPLLDRNVPVMLWYQGFRCGAESIWVGSVVSGYVFLLKPNRPELIGYLSAVEGIIQFFAACTAGVLADYDCHHRRYHHHDAASEEEDDSESGVRSDDENDDENDDVNVNDDDGGVRNVAATTTTTTANISNNNNRTTERPFFRRRDVLLRLASITGLVASGLVFVSCQIDTISTTGAVICLGIALGLNGAFDGVALTVSLALFADSIEDGDRSYYFTKRTLCTTTGQMIGPVVAVVLFYLLGDDWTIKSCGAVMQIAQLLLVPAFVLLWFFHEIKTTSTTTTSTTTTTTGHQTISTTDDGVYETTADIEERNYRLLDNSIDEANSQRLFLVEDPAAVDSNDDENTSSRPAHNQQQEGTHQYHRSVAACAATSDVVCAIAGGISLRYFTIFFLDNLVLGPVIVNLLDALSCVVSSILLVVAQRSSVRLGRCAVSISFKLIGSLFLLVMIGLYWYDDGRDGDEARLPLHVDVEYSTGLRQARPSVWTKVSVCFLYLLQNGFSNSTGALTRSLVMDNVPSHERAKWSALESINIFGWCGSAAIGGFFVRWLGGVLPVFAISASVQILGLLPLFVIVMRGNDQLETSYQ